MTQETTNPRLEKLSLTLLSILVRGGLRTWKRFERKKVSAMYYHGIAQSGWQYVRKQIEVAEYPEPEDVEAAMGDVALDYEVSVFTEDAVLTEIASILAERIFDKDVAGLRATCAKGDIEGAIRGLQQLLQRVRNVHVGGIRVENLYGEPFDEALTIYQRTANGQIGIPFPWPSMNAMTMGMWPGNLILAVARPGIGKTLMALLVARHAAVVADVDVTVISPEMLKWELAERAAAVDARVGYGKVVTGRLGDDELARYKAAKAAGLKRGIEVVDRRDFLDKKKDRDVLESVIEDAVERSMRAGRKRLVVVDALYKLGPEREQTERMIANVYWAIQMALTYDVPVFSTSQYNRAAGKGGTEGTLEDLGFSDVGAQEAHQIFGLFRDGDLKQQRQMGVKALKVRRMASEGRLEFNVHWDFGTMMFNEVDTSHEEFVDDELAEKGQRPKDKSFDY
jgi:KaiC/GvpD/RAD55 family RecA-like ATPase